MNPNEAHVYMISSSPERYIHGLEKGTADTNGSISRLRPKETHLRRHRLIIRFGSTKFIFKDTIPTASSTTLFGIKPIRIPEHEKFEKERRAFLRLIDSLLDHETYRGKFVAIHRGNVVGVGEDKRELARSVYAHFGYVPIYIGKVEGIRRIIEMPSPEGP